MSFLKNLLKYGVLIPQIIVLADSIYDHVSELDDDPAVQAAWEKLQADTAVALHIAALRSKFEMLRDLIKQLK